jgi:glycosyltransferase involved in cell wall biosynthesis
VRRVPEGVSAIIPAFDAEAFVADAVTSVLGQTAPVVECIVVDDGSSDDTAAVAERAGARVVRQSRGGQAAARNRGAAEARGDTLGFLDADDLWLPRRVERMLPALPQAGAVLCANRVVGAGAPAGPEVRLRPDPPSVASLLLWRGTVVSPGSNLLITRAAFEDVGRFDAALVPVEDWEFLVRLVERERLAYVDEILVEYRWHGGNATADLDALGAGLRRAYDRILQRRPQAVSRRRAEGGLHRMLAAAHVRLGSRRQAAAHLSRATVLDPLELIRAVAQSGRSRWPPK